ncbi:MAG: hypothetical protein DWQ02_09190 [Bacteroidetes bacterium]|nr:MAG: hypothetical protein DWQ02_09190 [Bacteroidota bacterium]
MYLTIFVEAERTNPSKLMADYSINGDQLARDVQAAIVEYSKKGYQLDQVQAVTSAQSTVSYTQGMLLVFKNKLG